MDNGAVNRWSRLQPGSATHPSCIACSHNCEPPGGTGRLLWSPMVAAWWRRVTEWEREEVSVRLGVARGRKKKRGELRKTTAVASPTSSSTALQLPLPRSHTCIFRQVGGQAARNFKSASRSEFPSSSGHACICTVSLVSIPPLLEMPVPVDILKKARLAAME